MKRVLKQSPIIFILTLFIGCNQQNIPVTPIAGTFVPNYPLAVGSSWVFLHETPLNGVIIHVDTLRQTVIGDTLVAGQQWRILETEDAYGNVTHELICQRADGLHLFYTDISQSVLKLKYPSSAHDKYISGYQVYLESDTLVTFSVTVDSTHEILHLPRWDYICYKYVFPEILTPYDGNSISDVPAEDWFLSAAGPVKRVFYAANNKPYAIWELLSTNVRQSR